MAADYSANQASHILCDACTEDISALVLRNSSQTKQHESAGSLQLLDAILFTKYDSAFISTKLQNWSVPKPCTERPSAHDGFTQFISNDRGHLLPGVPRSKTNPWGTFIGTWDMPLKIPPAKVSLTSRSADASRRLTDWVKRSESLVTACNGLRPDVTGKVSLNKEDHIPPQKQGRSTSQKSDRVPCSPQKEAPEGPADHPSSRSGGWSSHDDARKDHGSSSGRTSHHEDLVVEM